MPGSDQGRRRSINFNDLNFERPVPKSLVHKRRETNVLVTDVRQFGPDTFLCGGVVPRGHTFLDEEGREPTRDILFYTEMGRQASIAVSHRFFSVPMDHCFIMGGSAIELLGQCRGEENEVAADRIAIEIRIRQKQLRKGTLTTAQAEYALFSERSQVIRGTGSWNLQARSLFERVRRSALANLPAGEELMTFPRVEPAALGRRDAGNVVISYPERLRGEHFSARLQVDLKHPFFFDHPLDHVPGILVFEGCSQLAMLSIARATRSRVKDLVLDACEIRFDQFAELSLETELEAHIEGLSTEKDQRGTATVVVKVAQSGTSRGHALLHASFYS